MERPRRPSLLPPDSWLPVRICLQFWGLKLVFPSVGKLSIAELHSQPCWLLLVVVSLFIYFTASQELLETVRLLLSLTWVPSVP